MLKKKSNSARNQTDPKMTRFPFLFVFFFISASAATPYRCLTPDDNVDNTDTRFLNAITDPKRLWPNGILPYEFDSSVGDETKEATHLAMERIQNNTCLRFVNKSENDTNYVVFHKTNEISCYALPDGYYSHIGQHTISIGAEDSCIEHEIMHTIGLKHEHARHDRDDHITVNPEYIPKDKIIEAQYEKVNPNDYDPRGCPYNYLSVMHYDAQQIIQTPNGTYDDIIGSTDVGQPNDYEKINRMYNCSVEAVNHTCNCTGKAPGYPCNNESASVNVFIPLIFTAIASAFIANAISMRV